jgi:hypothetical protein|tara:strand:- start:929 stop:1402 length:474 start_codon:yes stop_codon:yes gene_type:complete
MADLTHNTITYNQILKKFEDVITANKFIKTFVAGDIYEIDLTETTYMYAHLSIESATFDNAQLTYSFRLYVMDIVNKDEGNENEVLSDTLQVINDVINEFRNGSSTFGLATMQNYDIQDTISCSPFTERFDNEVSGWSADIDVTVINHYNACNNPYS